MAETNQRAVSEDEIDEARVTEARVRREGAQAPKVAGLSVFDLLLAGILLAAGLVLKIIVGQFTNVFFMKPNFTIAMYCLAILLIRPKLQYALVIGLLAGVLCQIMPGTPYINMISEPIGAFVMAVLLLLPVSAALKQGSVKGVAGGTVVCFVLTFLSTLASGFSFIGAQYVVFYSGMMASIKVTPLAAFIPIIFGTATINGIIVGVLFTPLKKALKK